MIMYRLILIQSGGIKDMKKRILSGALALLMVVAMLSCISLSTVAAEQTKHYFVQSASDWVTAANITTEGYWDHTIIHIEQNIDFTGVSVPMFHNGKNFTGTIDGNGFTFSNLSMSTSGQYLGLVYCLKGTIKNLTISNSTFTINNSSARGGAFAASTSGGAVLYNCTSNATVTATKGDHLGGLIGTCTSGLKMDGCYFNGTVSGGAGTASALIGYGGNQARIYNSIALGTLTGGATGMIRIHANTFGALTNMPIYNSYCIGMNVANYNGTPADYEVAGATVNGHAYSAAGLEANYKVNSAAEAAWLVNNNREETNLPRVYFTVSSGGALRFGNLADQSVKLTVVNGDETTVSYRGTGDEITLAAINGKTPVATGALLEGHLLYTDNDDITVTYRDTAAVELEKARAALTALVDAYGRMNSALFTNWTAMQTWRNEARALLSSTNLSTLQSKIEAGKSLPRVASNIGYISISEYPIYKTVTSIKNYSVGSKAEWLAAVEMSNGARNAEAYDFSGITIHLTADIDMENTPMLPLCYNGYFDGNLDGHGHVFKNININIDTPRGPVGLIAQLRNYRWVQNLGVASGMVTVTGSPIYKRSFGIDDAGNKVGVLIGKAHNHCYIRKCWNGASTSVENRDNAAGLIGDARSLSYMDGCFNLGIVSGHGLIGYGAASAKITNSFNGGTTAGTQYHVNMLNAGKLEEDFLVNTYSLGGLLGYTGANVTYTEEQKNIRDAFNATVTVNSAKEAAWRVNQNYTAQNLGDKSDFRYTLDANGTVTFGTTQNQIRRITMKCEGTADEYLYAAAGSTIELSYDLDANYYALVGSYSGTTLQGNKLKVGNEDITVQVRRNVDRGNVNGDTASNLLDAQIVLRQVAGLTNTADVAFGDVNGNGRLDADDAVIIIRAWLGDENSTFEAGLPDTEGYLKVVSYNIKVMHYEHSTGGNLPANQVPAKMQEVAQTLRELDGDIVGLQEVDYLNSRTGNIDQVKWLAEQLGYGYYRFTSTTGNYGTAVMSRYPILKSEDFYFAGNVRENGCRLDGYEPRGFSRNEVDTDLDGVADLIFYNTHLGNFTPQQLQYMSAWLEADYDAGRKVVCTGDYNLWPYEMIGRFNTDKLTALNGGDDFNFYEETTTPEYGNAIDNIIVSDNMEYYWDTARDCGVIEYQSTASDHCPIYTYIKVK